MLSRFIAKHSNVRFLTLLTSQSHLSNHKHHTLLPVFPPIPNPNFFNSLPTITRHFSSNRDNNNNNSSNQPGFWNISSENDVNVESIFGEDTGNLQGTMPDAPDARSRQVEDPWVIESKGKEDTDIFKDVEDRKPIGTSSGGIDEWKTAEGYKDWNIGVDDGKEEEVFDFGNFGKEVPLQENEALVSVGGNVISVSQEESEEQKKLKVEEEKLRAAIKGSNRAFGDLITASGITEAMLDSLILLKDMEGIEGLPPLHKLEELRYENNTKKSSRAEIERLKQEEVAKARVRDVDSHGRAYGTGKRKCSIARVWIQPGEGKFVVNDKQFDVYFPMLDHRAALLRPFTETKTLGLMDVTCTVKGGGVSGQVGAIRLGISRALQNWAPDETRPPLKAAGFLTRDSRVVERKKPGKAKARKSYQWVKR